MADVFAEEPCLRKSLHVVESSTPEELEALGLTFSVDPLCGPTVDLKEGGQTLAVNAENREEYASLLVLHWQQRHEDAAEGVRRGFLEVLGDKASSQFLDLYDVNTLQAELLGQRAPSVSEMRARAEYQGYEPDDEAVEHFWGALRAFSEEQLALFWRFITGSSRSSALSSTHGGKITIIHAGGPERYPHCATCFRAIHLPEYISVDQCSSRLLEAFDLCVGFDLA